MECAYTSPMRTKCGMFVMHCMQCCMSVSAVLQCVDVLSRGGIYMFAIVIFLVLLMCTLTHSLSLHKAGKLSGGDSIMAPFWTHSD